MKTILQKKYLSMLMLGATIVVFSGCSDSDDPDPDPAVTLPITSMATFSVMVTNITNGQPLTPLAVIAHHENYSPWQLGSAATVGLEMLAESGSPVAYLAEADGSDDVLKTASSTNGPFAPGATETVMITVMEASDLEISVAAMLAKTNDAFAGLSKVAVGSMAVGDSTTLLARAYDAGTELNTETAGTIPAPVLDGDPPGIGFDMERNDIGNFISVSAGVVTKDDGFTTSDLLEIHRWLGPVAKVTITRMP